MPPTEIETNDPKSASNGGNLRKFMTSTSLTQHLSRLRIHKTDMEDPKQKQMNPPPVRGQQLQGAAATAPPVSPEEVELPQQFVVKYLGKRDAKGLWGIKHTRKPVDDMVFSARAQAKVEVPLPFLHLVVTEKGVKLEATRQNPNKNFDSGPFPIDCISYGVQDLVYTRVFAMIVVRDNGNSSQDGSKIAQSAADYKNPFECYAFVCDSKQNARRLTFALAKAFQDFSKTVKNNPQKRKPKPFAIDIRTPEQIEEDLKNEADSEV